MNVMDERMNVCLGYERQRRQRMWNSVLFPAVSFVLILSLILFSAILLHALIHDPFHVRAKYLIRFESRFGCNCYVFFFAHVFSSARLCRWRRGVSGLV